MKNTEAYKHRYAKEVLREWLESDYEIDIERPFKINGKYAFVPDVTCSVNGSVISFYEVVNKHSIGGKKLGYFEDVLAGIER